MCSSQIDTTAVQALIDTRNEVERWADHPVEFHFATVLSPWIRRALVAGGFGIGAPATRAHPELVQVVSYGDVRGPAQAPEKGDLESIGGIEDVHRRGSTSSASQATAGPIVLQDTPFFHFDVVSAVRAAESGVRRVPSTPSVGSLDDAKRPEGVE